MKRFVLILIVLMITYGLFASGKEEAQILPKEPISVHILAPNGTPAMAMSGFAAKEGEILPGYPHTLEVVQAADLVASKLIKGEAQFAIIPTNLASTLYNKGVDIQIAGIVIWGNLYVLSADPQATWESMKGNEIYMLGRGLSPDILLQHLMKENGIDPQSDVTLKYVGASSELAPSFLTGKSRFTIMPEPMLTVVKSKKPNVNVMVDLQEEWSSIYGTDVGFPQACLVVSGEMGRNHPDYVEAFIEEFSQSVGWMATHPAEAGELGATIIDGMSAEILAQSLPQCNLVYTPIGAAREDLEAYYQVLFDFDANTIGGALPGDDSYLP